MNKLKIMLNNFLKKQSTCNNLESKNIKQTDNDICANEFNEYTNESRIINSFPKMVVNKNGKPIKTREYIRALNEKVDPLKELITIIKQYFPELIEWLDALTDTRNQSYVKYDITVCIIVQLLAFCSSYKSMNEIGREFNSQLVFDNINKLLKTNYSELPHKDTLINVISGLKFEELEEIQTNIIKKLIRSKMLDKYRFHGYFYIAIDGTGLYSTRKYLGENAITKTHNEGEENEYKTYEYYALEAKLICGNMTFSLATEFVENETYIDENGNEVRRFEKQDCELKAAYRLLQKIKERFPRLPIIIGGDALYLGRPFIEMCKGKFGNKKDKGLGFEYIIRYKETDAPSIKREFDKIKITSGNYEYQNGIIFGELKNKEFCYVNLVSYTEQTTDEKGNIITKKFAFATSLMITEYNKEDMVFLGRRRWKIENKGFKAQKSDVLNIEHIYTKDCDGTKNIYMIIQFAHTLLNMLYYGDLLIKKLDTTLNEISRLIRDRLITQNIDLNINKLIQLRFP